MQDASQKYDSVNIAVRVRSFTYEEQQQNVQSIIQLDNNQIIVYHPESKEGLLYKFNQCFDGESKIFEVYQTIGIPLVNAFLDGYNSALILYGPSKTGKSELFFGTEAQDEGLVQLLFREIYKAISSRPSNISYSVTVSFWEMNNESIVDLLAPQQKKLKVTRTSTGSVIQKLAELKANQYDDVENLLEKGKEHSLTLTNLRGVRWHSFIKVTIIRTDDLYPEKVVNSSFLLANLKGTERIGKQGAKSSLLRQGASLNKSITHLGNSIHNLVKLNKSNPNATTSQRRSIFGDSKVTEVLADALSGKWCTTILGNISPSEFHYLETMDTLENLRIAAYITSAPIRRELSTRAGKVLLKIETLKKSLPIDTLAEGHPPTEQQELLQDLEDKFMMIVQEDSNDKVNYNSMTEKHHILELKKLVGLRKPKTSSGLGKKSDKRGTIYIPKKDGTKDTYKGQWMGYERHGDGEFNSSTERYRGGWSNNKYNGFGIKWVKENDIFRRVYKGEWRHGKRDGKGICYYNSGDIYEGDWKDDTRHGHGTMWFANGMKSEGEWSNDKKNGVCLVEEPDGNKFEGNFKNGLRHGDGIYYYSREKQKYVGVWFNGSPKCGEFMSTNEEEEENSLPIIGLQNPQDVLNETKNQYGLEIASEQFEEKREGELGTGEHLEKEDSLEQGFEKIGQSDEEQSYSTRSTGSSNDNSSQENRSDIE